MNVLKALYEGKKVRNKQWKSSGYIELDELNNVIMWVRSYGKREPLKKATIIHYNNNWEIVEPEHKELTVEEIEAKLGYKVKIVGDK